jgi:cellulose 1,4-beta-cellobiosidase
MSQLYVNISVCNASGASLSLAGMTLKYWYTADGAATVQTASADYSPITPAPTLTATLLPLPAYVGGDSVLSIKFGATTLAAGACTGAIQIRIFAQGYQCCYAAQAGDYSYLAGTALADNQNIAAYNAQGLLIWGLEPAPAK